MQVEFSEQIARAVRPVFFQTDLEEFLYATHGGTLFLVKFRGRTYALTCSHVFGDFRHGSLFITQEKQAKNGGKPAPIKTFCYPSSPRDDAVGTDLGDICIIEFENDLPPEFFMGSEYVIEEKTVVTSKAGHILHVPGVLKEKTRILPPDITIGYCRLEFRDAGTTSSDPTLRHATAKFWQPEFASITGISGSPVFDVTANALCGMVVRGGMKSNVCDIYYIDAFDILRFLEAVNDHNSNVYYLKSRGVIS